MDQEKQGAILWEPISAGIGALALAVALAALVATFLARRDQRTQLLTDVRQRWEELSDHWATALLLREGGFTYYSDAPIRERRRVAQLVKKFSLRGSPPRDKHFELRAETRHIRKVARYFAYVADAVLSGKLSVSDAYAVFGPDVARHHDAALWISGRLRVRDGKPTFYDVQQRNPEWANNVDQITEWTFYEEQSAIVLLLWLLAGEQARRGDTSAHLLLDRAQWFESSGEHQRVARSTWTLSLARGRFPWRPRLRARLRLASAVRASFATTKDAEPIFQDGMWQYTRGKLLRKLKRELRESTDI